MYVEQPSSVQGLWQIITWSIVFLGWYVVNNQNNAREYRKEIRSSLDRLIIRIEKLEESAINFHRSKFDAFQARQILKEIQTIQKATMRIYVLSDSKQNLLLIEIRRSVSLRNFDASSHKELNIQDSQLDQISSALSDLIDELEYGFLVKFYIQPSRVIRNIIDRF